MAKVLSDVLHVHQTGLIKNRHLDSSIMAVDAETLLTILNGFFY
jgi:hypothetical protein